MIRIPYLEYIYFVSSYWKQYLPYIERISSNIKVPWNHSWPSKSELKSTSPINDMKIQAKGLRKSPPLLLTPLIYPLRDYLL